MNEEQLNEILAGQQLQQQQGAMNQQTQQQLMFQEMEKGLAEEQLDLKEIIKDIFKLIAGNKLMINSETGNYEWGEATNPIFKTQLRILSDYGIQKVMEKVIFYVNKSTLLSNYDESEINKIMFDFTTCLNDFVLMRYESFFYEPTFEECILILKERMEYKEKLRAFVLKTMGFEVDKEQIKNDVILEMEGTIEREIGKIKAEELEKRINEYDSITMEIEHQVYNTYKRAEGGIERGSLRKHSSFSEVRALQPEQIKRGGMFSWLKG